MAADFLRRAVGPALRPGLLPRHAHCRQLPRRLRYHDAQLEHHVLAGVPQPGDMYGIGGRAIVYTQSGAGGDLV